MKNVTLTGSQKFAIAQLRSLLWVSNPSYEGDAFIQMDESWDQWLVSAVNNPLSEGYYLCIQASDKLIPLPLLVGGWENYKATSDRQTLEVWDRFYSGSNPEFGSDTLTSLLEYYRPAAEHEFRALLATFIDLIAEVNCVIEDDRLGGFVPRWAA